MTQRRSHILYDGHFIPNPNPAINGAGMLSLGVTVRDPGDYVGQHRKSEDDDK